MSTNPFDSMGGNTLPPTSTAANLSLPKAAPAHTKTFTKYDSTNLHEYKDNGKPTIILVGHTGAGKGRLGNWLHDCGLADDELQPFDFPEAKQHLKKKDFNEPCTTEPSLVVLDKINVLDTAGINDPKDLKNMFLLANFLKRVKSLHLVVLVIPFSYKKDLSYSESLPYYFCLLSPLFTARQVIIAFTQVDDGLYQQQVEEHTWSEFLNAKRDGVNSILGDHCSKIDIALPFNTVYRRSKLQSTLKDIETGGSYPSSIMGRSLISRDNLFRLVSMFSPVDITGMLFPLPPSAERLRLQVLQQAKDVKAQIQETVAIEDTARGKTLEILQHHQSTRSEIEATLRVKIAEKKEKENPCIRTDPAFAWGDDMINWNVLIKPETCVVVTSPVDKFQEFVINKGCTYEREIKMEGGNPKQRVYSVTPSFFNFQKVCVPEFSKEGDQSDPKKEEKDDLHRWYFRAWLEYDGAVVYATQIALLSAEIAKCEAQLDREKLAMKKSEDEVNLFDDKLTKHRATLDALTDTEELLSNKLFKLDEVDQVVKAIDPQLYADLESVMQKVNALQIS